MRRESRSVEDGYANELTPGLRASADARRLAQELAFSAARLAALAADPPGLYAQARAEGALDMERATWTCFLLAYLSPAEEGDPFAGVAQALAAAPAPRELPAGLGELLDGLPRGPRSSHEPGRGTATLEAYGQWIARSGGTQAAAFAGDPSWPPERRFARIFERLTLPGLGRAGRFELLVTLGRLGLYDLRADSLHPEAARGAEDPATLAAKRVFGIADPLLIDRRAAALAEAAGVPLEALDLALANWAGERRASMGFAGEAPAAPAVAAALAL